MVSRASGRRWWIIRPRLADAQPTLVGRTRLLRALAILALMAWLVFPVVAVRAQGRTVRVGVYEPKTGDRLLISQGPEAGNDGWVIGQVDIAQDSARR